MRKTITCLIIATALLLLLSGCEGAFDSRFSVEKTFNLPLTEEPFALLKLLIHSRNGNITVVPVQGREGRIDVKMHVKAASLEEAQEIAQENVALTFQSDLWQLVIDERRINASIYAEIPQYFEYDLNLKTIGGGISLEGLVCREISLQCQNGPLELNQISADTLKGYTSNGTLMITDVQAKKIDLLTSNGEIYFSGEATDLDLVTSNGAVVLNLKPFAQIMGGTNYANYNVKTTNGNIEVFLPKENDFGYNVQARADDGDIRFDMLGFESIKNGEWQTRNFNQGILRAYFDLKTTNGSIIIDEVKIQ